MRWRWALTTAALTTLATLALTVPAPSQQGCRTSRGVACPQVRVPLDRSGRLAGSIDLEVVRLGRARPYLMYLSGGPGGAGVAELLSVLFEVPALAGDFTVLGFDQRGTGGSGLLRCRAIERDGRLRSTAAAARCARRLGARRAFYTTADTVQDMEAIRSAVGARRLTLFGISYGTKLALAYARAHPDRVSRMVLDSVVDPDDPDPFGLAGFRAMAASLRSLCSDGCRSVSADPGADLGALVARLRAAPLRGDLYRASGRRVRRALTPTAIADLLYDADYAPALRAGVPAAVRAALDHGDAAPLLRIIDAARGLTGPSDPRVFSAARYAAVCEETPLPWPRGTPLADRFAVARERALALPPSAFAPFDAEVAYADEIDLCLRWPDPGQPPPPSGGAYPPVPALLLQGAEDLRTPPEVSARVAALLPGARRVTLPGVGHAVIGADPSGCGRRQLRRFLAGRDVRAGCPRVPTGVPATGVPPASFAELAPAAGLAGRVGRTVTALDATLDWVSFALSPGLGSAGRGGGLRGGRYRLAGGRRLVLERVVVVPGVRVSGSSVPGSPARLRLRVGGSAAARGTVRVGRRGRLSGRLGGVLVRAALANRPPGRSRGFVARAASVSPVAARP